jgi:hypothetical protein
MITQEARDRKASKCGGARGWTHTIASVTLARISSPLRTSALIALGAFAVHQLRYLASYGDGAGAALGAQGHAYLQIVFPLVLVVACSATLGSLAVTALARPRFAARGGVRWAYCTLALLTIFGVQESAEGLLSAGHPGGPAAVVGHGGWIVLPIAALVGRMVALLFRGLESIERTLASPRPRWIAHRPASLGLARSMERPSLVRAPLAFGLARRPPPRLF